MTARKGLLLTSAVLALLVAVTVAAALMTTPGLDTGSAVRSLGMFEAAKWTEHYRAPSDEQIERLLKHEGVSLAGPDGRAKGVEAFREEWAKRNPTTPNPEKLQELLDKERSGQRARMAAQVMAEPQIMSLAVPMEFPNTDTFDAGPPFGEVTMTGPLHNQMAPPGPRDNNTVWYKDANPALYNKLYFGVGPNAGVIIDHPNLGKVDLRGNTMANYYLEQSEGQFQPKGLVYPKWLQATHSEAWYGDDNNTGSNHNIRAADLVREAVDAINTDNPGFRWADYDGDGNGIVDNFTVIHAGAGQESGGGAQGTFSIWSHASTLNAPTGYLACSAGVNGAPRDIYVREYSMDPENIDIGVISEEFGHAAFGLPDIYTTDLQASPANWTIMESGSWNGPLGGMEPAPFPLYFRYLIGWADPLEVNFDTAPIEAKVGQLSQRPKGTEYGIKINLPDQVIDTPNPLGTGKAWWSDRRDNADDYLDHSFDLAGATSPIFAFQSAWSFEADYDYGYVEVSTDGGSTWVKLADMDGTFVDDGMGNLGLNGEGTGALRFNLAPYAGEQVVVRLHYTSDVGVQWAGWWADDFTLTDGATTIFADDVESGTDGWSTNRWVIVPLTRVYPMYYLAEWRNNRGFDHGLKYPYQTVYSNDATNEWEVDRTPYSVPGMLLWLRNGAYDFDYTLGDATWDEPSIGPKHALLLVDSHYWPLAFDTPDPYYEDFTSVRLNSRSQPCNAAFTVQKTTSFKARLGFDPSTGEYLDTPLETKTFESQDAVSQFHDSLGYYPGVWIDWDYSYVWDFWHEGASAVVPATAPYTTKVTLVDKTPYTDLYGATLGGHELGTGDPRDSGGGVQYGVNIAVLDKGGDGKWGNIAVWNARSLGDLKISANKPEAVAGKGLTYQLTITNVSPARQTFSVLDPMPVNTTYQGGAHYNKTSDSIEWTGTLEPGRSRTISFTVKVNAGTPSGTEIKNKAKLFDDTMGAEASLTTVVK